MVGRPMKEKQESISLSAQTMEFVEGLMKLGVCGGKKKSAVLRYLIEEAIKQMVRDDFVNKYLQTQKSLEEHQ